MDSGDNTRAIALDILLKYEKEGNKLRPLLISVLAKNSRLDRRDRAFIKALTEGTAERCITLDWITDQVSDTGTKKMKPVIRMILRLGVYQLVFMKQVPDSAAVDESVKLAKRRRFYGLSGFVNGVLRAVIRLRDQGISYPDISTEYSCPHWISDVFIRDYGEEKAHAMIRSSVGGRPVYLRLNRRLTDADKLISLLSEEGFKVQKTDYPYTLKADPGQIVPSESQSFKKGLWSVQDLSSQIAMYALWKEIEVYIRQKNRVDINVIDLCAAPGGKICFLSGMLNDGNSRLMAFDISENKLAKIRENTERLGIDSISDEIHDAVRYDPKLCASADVIIADLPCSGLGVIGRKVDIKYRIKQDDILELCKQQRKILDNAEKYLKPGGILMFSVCTVTKEETAEQSDYIATLGLVKTGERILLQGVDPCDGFYYSLWKKNNNEGHF